VRPSNLRVRFLKSSDFVFFDTYYCYTCYFLTAGLLVPTKFGSGLMKRLSNMRSWRDL